MTTTEPRTKTIREMFEPAIQLAERLGITGAEGAVLIGNEPALYFSARAIEVESILGEFGLPVDVDQWDNARWPDIVGVRVTIHDWPRKKCPECGGTGRK